MRALDRVLPVVLLGCLGALALVAGSCGGGAPDRPVIIATYPANGQAMPGLVHSIRITYDTPVDLLMIDQLVLTSGGVRIPLWIVKDPNDPASVIGTPVDGTSMQPGSNHVRIEPGFVVNEDRHYRLENYNFSFTLGAVNTFFLGTLAPTAVVEVDAETFAFVHSTPTPAGRSPIGLAGSAIATQQRVWVQLFDPGGTAEALAWFTPGDAAMTPIALTCGNDDLYTSYPAIALTPDGTTLFAAYREEQEDRVRLHRIDAVTGLETGTVLLSPTGTSPGGLSVSPDGGVVDIACHAGTGDVLVSVDAQTMVEDDIGPGPGTDGLPLPVGAGPTVSRSQSVLVAPTRATTAHLTEADTWSGTLDEYGSVTPGKPVQLLVTPLGSWVFTGLWDYANDEPVVLRPLTDLADDTPLTVLSLTSGANPPATRVYGMARHPATSEVYVLLDNDAIAVLSVGVTDVTQKDLDDATPDAQSADISTAAATARNITFLPPARLP
jgi:hypothetical protein